jgi:hypothetical protein
LALVDDLPVDPEQQNLFAPGSGCASLALEEFPMKAMSFVFVVLAASMLAGCGEEKAKPTAEPAKPAAAAPSANAAPPAAPAKPAEKKDEGGW